MITRRGLRLFLVYIRQLFSPLYSRGGITDFSLKLAVVVWIPQDYNNAPRGNLLLDRRNASTTRHVPNYV